jgi:hypothetical protein
MRACPWLEVQRGSLDFGRGQYGAAELHYRRANAAYPGYWLVDKHIAESRALSLNPAVGSFHVHH